MDDTLVEPHTIPNLDELDFEDLEHKVGVIRQSSGGLEQKGGRVDAQWFGGMSVNYLAPKGAVWAEKMLPVKWNAATIAEACRTTADALQDYVRAGQPIKDALRQLKRDAEDLATRARPLGEEWRHKQELVEENDRIKKDVSNRVRDLEDAKRETADKIHATNDGPGTNAADLLGRDFLGNSSYVTLPIFALSAWATQHKWGQFKPVGPWRDGVHRRLPVKNQSPWRNARRAMKADNWVARPGSEGLRNVAGKIGKWGFRFGSVASGVNAGLSQAGSDAQDRHMPEWKRGTRATVKGVATSAGYYYGADGGMAAGAFVGSLVAPGLGTVVGGVVGGIIGAGAGSWGAGKAADGVNNLIGTD